MRVCAYLEKKPSWEVKLPLKLRTGSTTSRFVSGPLGALKAQQELISSAAAKIGKCSGARPLELDADLTMVAAQTYVGFGQQEGEGVGDRVVWPGDGDLTTDDTRLRIWKLGMELGNGCLGSCGEQGESRLVRRHFFLIFFNFSDGPLGALRELAPVMLLSPEHEEEADRNSLTIWNKVLLQGIRRKGM